MFNISFTTMAAMLTGICCVAGAAEPALAAGTYLRTTTVSVDLSDSSGVPVTLTQVTIPAGTWIVTAKANPVNFGEADYARCLLIVGTAQKDAAASLIGDAAPGPTGEIGPSVAEIVLSTAFASATSKTVKLECQHDFDTPGIYVDPGATILVSTAPGPLG